VPNNFSEVPRLLRESTRCAMVLAAAAPMGQARLLLARHNCDFVAARIGSVPFFTPGSMVTTLKNTVDHIVTEYGVADMRGRSISQRAAALIAIAHPTFRDGLTVEARTLGYL
jgi:Acetyl-CoA hydrolase/transferase C-terminal domain